VAREFYKGARNEIDLKNQLNESVTINKVILLALRKREVRIAKKAGEELVNL